MTEAPQPFRVPSTGFLLEYDGQVYAVERTSTQVGLDRDSQGRERHMLEIKFQASWTEEGYTREDYYS
jgi:hypothetical protein